MSKFVVGDGDSVEIRDGQAAFVVQANVPVGGGGIPLAVSFRLPMKNLDKPWYEATRVFGRYNYHPEKCEDWNLESGGNTDLGEPLVAPFNGIVLSAHNWGGGTGRVIQILCLVGTGKLVAWSGWHLKDVGVVAGDVVHVGQYIGSIGNADGRYAGAHLHEQICIVNQWGIPAPATFASDSRYDWQQPSVFYVEHGVDADLVMRVASMDGR
jgi:hypothetical protein